MNFVLPWHALLPLLEQRTEWEEGGAAVRRLAAVGCGEEAVPQRRKPVLRTGRSGSDDPGDNPE